MKSYSDNDVYRRVNVPHGDALPRAPIAGEIFLLDRDMPIVSSNLPWYPRGTYVYSGSDWLKLNDTPRARKAAPIGAIKLENEVPEAFGNIPTRSTGHELASLVVTPTNGRASFSGTASLWIDVDDASYVWIAAFRESVLVGFTGQFIEVGKPTSIMLTFVDAPPLQSRKLSYTLRAYSSSKKHVCINRTASNAFDGTSQTAFIVEENS